MKINNNNMLSLINLINKCANNVTGKTAYAMMRNRQILSRELKPFEEAREQLAQRYGTMDETGNFKLTQDPGTDEYQQFINELSELLNIELDVDIYKIPEDSFHIEFTDALKLSEYDILHALLVEC